MVGGPVIDDLPTLTVESRFAGPPGSGNGGYTAGRLAGLVSGPGSPVRVTLRQPPPLDIAMEIGVAGAAICLRHGKALVADAEPGRLEARSPPPVSVEAARSAQTSYAGRTDHPFPGCFVCGTDRLPGDGLLLTPGLIAPGQTACGWRPDVSLSANDAGRAGALVADEFVWAALDCPGGWASDLDARPLVLGRMTATCDVAPHVGEDYVVVGQLLDTQGRKTYTATALYDANSQLLARAEHTWIAIDPASFSARS